MSHDESHPTGGFALVAVLVFLALFAMFLAPFVTASRIRILTVSNRFESARLDLAAQSITNMLSAKLRSDPIFKTRLLEISRVTPQKCSISGMTVTLQVLDQTSLIDLNKAAPDLLAAGLRSVGLEAAAAEKTAHAMSAFRSVQTTDRAVWEVAMPQNGLKHGPFEDLSELHEFGPLEVVSLERLARVFTLFNASGNIANRSIDATLQDHLSANQSATSYGSALSSEALSLATSLTARGATGYDYAVIGIDNGTKEFRRLASLRLRPVSNPSGNLPPCADTTGSDIESFIKESLKL
jgi:general secretion pathway protein K